MTRLLNTFFQYLAPFNDENLPRNGQCDQIAKHIFQYLATFNDENLPNSIKHLPKLVLNLNKIIKILPKTFKKIQKWWNCAKSGHSGHSLRAFAFLCVHKRYVHR